MTAEGRDEASDRSAPRCPHCGDPLHAAGSDDRPLWECPDDGYISFAE